MPESRPGPPTALRIALVTRAIYPVHGVGGLERSTYDLARHLLRRGVRLHIVTRPGHALTADDPLSPPQATWHHVPYRTFPFAGRRGTTAIDRSTAYPVFGYLAGRLASQLVARGDVDVVIGNGASALGYAVARRRDPAATAPFVLNPHGLEEFGGPDGTFGGHHLKRLAYMVLRAAVRRSAAAADCVIATDRVLVPIIGRHLGVSEDRIAIVPNAVDLDDCDAAATREDGLRLRASARLGPRAPVLLSVGRLEQNKGLHVLAAALAQIQDLPWHWVIAGDGPFRSRLESFVADAGIGARTRLCGRVDDATLHAWYEAGTVFVHPTLYEGSSIVTLEAMAHRLPVVATTAGGLPDKVRPGETGWLVPPGDVAALVVALRSALASPDALPAMGAAGRALAEQEFSWTRSAKRMLDVCAGVVARHTR
jgi:glycosyltransferase involved in cell wall biosynthesis